MTKEELEKATGQELIEKRNYCGVDGYYGDYLDNVNAEMLKRFNRLADLEKENAGLKNKLEHRNCLDCSNHSSKLRMRTLELEKENAELKADNAEWEKASDKWKSVYELTNNQLTKARELLRQLVNIEYAVNIPKDKIISLRVKAEQFLNGVEK